MTSDRRCLGLLRRRSCWIPTWRGWAILALTIVGLAWLTLRGTYPYLAVNAPQPGGTLVVEGWAPDYVIEAAVKEFKRQPYERLCVTGGPLERGSPLSEFKTYAELGAASALKLGLTPREVQAVPAPEVAMDRTYTSAGSLSQWLQAHGAAGNHVNVITLGAHARRTRLLFVQALPPNATVGIVAVRNEDFDPAQWWRTSQGVRTVIGEVIAYAYVRLAFRPPKG